MMDRLSQFAWFRVLWSIPVAWLLWTKYNVPRGHHNHMSLYEEWQYALGLSEMLTLEGEYISPSDAIAEDSHYWTD